ncbi:hypothetical protein MCUN1_002134 [Malassezia cuniculi]|uniref:Glycolipid 2-alpha-mannosyltransferase n=1 Tax=Malassezia cuniculi TaxID=948313 RepID=A0AAF0ER59_9BASI|nr:hypothetical protein MCUN1_002134 [Malassezia cuniculi]
MFEAILRRPQRLLIIVLGCVIVLFITTYFSISENSAEMIRDRIQHLPYLHPSEVSCPSPAVAQNTGSIMPQTIADVRKLATVGDDTNLYPPEFVPHEVNKMPRVKAGFVVLVRNQELEDMKSSMRDVEDRFNRKFGYPWIFLNDKPFTEEFKNGVRSMTRSECRFGLVPTEHWSYPSWIDQEKAAREREKMVANDVIYGGSESYRHMCRFQSGFFWRNNATLDLDYYWRVEPGVRLYCDIDYDPFMFMAINNKQYGFTISLHEYEATIPTLWKETQEFIRAHPEFVASDNALGFITDDPSKGIFDQKYNNCHFWSNFEIGDMRLWRSPAYRAYFEHLDRAGGFFYERWGDAPVHSIAASIFLNRSQIHHFEDIGYYHVPFTHCPANIEKFHKTGKCRCDPSTSNDKDGFMCMKEWWRTSIEGKPK